MAETELERAERRVREAQARLQTLKNKEAQKQRKLATRRKVILGGALVDLADRDDAALGMVERLLRNLSRDIDRAAFEGWDVRGIGEREAQASKSLQDSKSSQDSRSSEDSKVAQAPESAPERGSEDQATAQDAPPQDTGADGSDAAGPSGDRGWITPKTSHNDFHKQMRAQEEADRAAGLSPDEQRQARLERLKGKVRPMKGAAE